MAQKGVKGGSDQKTDNNGQATHVARKHAWPTQAAWANYKLPVVYQVHYCPNISSANVEYHGHSLKDMTLSSLFTTSKKFNKSG